MTFPEDKITGGNLADDSNFNICKRSDGSLDTLISCVKYQISKNEKILWTWKRDCPHVDIPKEIKAKLQLRLDKFREIFAQYENNKVCAFSNIDFLLIVSSYTTKLKFDHFSLQIGSKEILSFLHEGKIRQKLSQKMESKRSQKWCWGGCKVPKCVWDEKGCSGLQGCKRTYNYKKKVGEWSTECNSPAGSEAGNDYMMW